MENKCCTKCGLEKPLTEFPYIKSTDKFRGECKNCTKEINKEWREQNKLKLNEKSKKFYFENKEYSQNYYLKNKERILENRGDKTDYNKEYYNENKTRLKEKYKTKKLEYGKKYRQDNKDKLRLYRNHRYQTDILYRLRQNIKRSIQLSFNNKNINKISNTQIILGCTYQEFKDYLESKFEPWMSWENKGNPKDGILEPNKTWDIDHIIPISNAITKEDIIRLNHYTNLQPLCSYYNRNIKKDN